MAGRDQGQDPGNEQDFGIKGRDICEGLASTLAIPGDGKRGR